MALRTVVIAEARSNPGMEAIKLFALRLLRTSQGRKTYHKSQGKSF